jgi:hypothetical protein
MCICRCLVLLELRCGFFLFVVLVIVLFERPKFSTLTCKTEQKYISVCVKLLLLNDCIQRETKTMSLFYVWCSLWQNYSRNYRYYICLVAMQKVANILPSYILNKTTPSADDGVDLYTEKLHRIFGCELVVQAGTLLRLPQVALVTGQNVLNRFYYRYLIIKFFVYKIYFSYVFLTLGVRKSLKRFDVFTVAMGSILLASKVEECFKTLREVFFLLFFFI